MPLQRPCNVVTLHWRWVGVVLMLSCKCGAIYRLLKEISCSFPYSKNVEIWCWQHVMTVPSCRFSCPCIWSPCNESPAEQSNKRHRKCEQAIKRHKKIKGTRTHSLVAGNNMTSSGTQQQRRNFTCPYFSRQNELYCKHQRRKRANSTLHEQKKLGHNSVLHYMCSGQRQCASFNVCACVITTKSLRCAWWVFALCL